MEKMSFIILAALLSCEGDALKKVEEKRDYKSDLEVDQASEAAEALLDEAGDAPTAHFNFVDAASDTEADRKEIEQDIDEIQQALDDIDAALEREEVSPKKRDG